MMKFVFPLLLLCSSLNAQIVIRGAVVKGAVLGQVATGAGGCTTASTTGGNTGGGNDQILGNNPGTKYIAEWFTADDSSTFCKVGVRLKVATGSPTFTITAQVWTYNSGAGTPGSPIGSPSDAVNSSTFTGTYGLINFPNMSAALTSGTDYCLVLVTSATDGSNYVEWDEGGITAQSHATGWKSPDGSAWTTVSIANLTQGVFTLYK